MLMLPAGPLGFPSAFSLADDEGSSHGIFPALLEWPWVLLGVFSTTYPLTCGLPGLTASFWEVCVIL